MIENVVVILNIRDNNCVYLHKENQLKYIVMSKSVKGTETEKNLLKSFAGESQARNRYTFFASVAKKEGFEQIAGVFTETAEQEKEHAKKFFKFLEGGMVEITASYPAGRISTTKENLMEAAAGENEEWTELYPNFADVAEKEGFPAIAAIVIVDVMRGGPGLGTIQPSQSDYFQVVKGGGHGDYKLIVLAPYSVQESNDFVELGFELAFKYRTPVIILSDGMIGQMMEKVVLSPFKPRWTDEYIAETFVEWATTGRPRGKNRNIATSLQLEAHVMEEINHKLQAKFRQIEENEVRYDTMLTDDADYVLVAYGSSARICSKVVEMAREDGHKVGMLRPITLFPYPTPQISAMADRAKGFMAVEMSAGQMVEDVRLAVNGKVPVFHYGRFGGIVPSPKDVYDALKKNLLGGE